MTVTCNIVTFRNYCECPLRQKCWILFTLFIVSCHTRWGFTGKRQSVTSYSQQSGHPRTGRNKSRILKEGHRSGTYRIGFHGHGLAFTYGNRCRNRRKKRPSQHRRTGVWHGLRTEPWDNWCPAYRVPSGLGPPDTPQALSEGGSGRAGNRHPNKLKKRLWIICIRLNH